MSITVVVSLKILDFIGFIIESVEILFKFYLIRSGITVSIVFDKNIFVIQISLSFSSLTSVLLLMFLHFDFWSTWTRTNFIWWKLLNTEIKESFFWDIEFQIYGIGSFSWISELPKTCNTVRSYSSCCNITWWKQVFQIMTLNCEISIKTKAFWSFVIDSLLFNIFWWFNMLANNTFVSSLELAIKDWFLTSPISLIAASDSSNVIYFLIANFTCALSFDSTCCVSSLTFFN